MLFEKKVTVLLCTTSSRIMSADRLPMSLCIGSAQLTPYIIAWLRVPSSIELLSSAEINVELVQQFMCLLWRRLSR